MPVSYCPFKLIIVFVFINSYYVDFFHSWHGHIFCMFWYRVGGFSVVFFLSHPGPVCFYTHTPYPSSQIILRSVYCFFPLSYHLRFVALSKGQRPAGAYCPWWGLVPPLFGDLKLSLFYSTRDRMHLRGSTHHYAWKRVHAAPLSAFTKSWSSFAAVTLEGCFLLKCPLTQFAHSSTTWEGINDHSWMCGFRFFSFSVRLGWGWRQQMLQHTPVTCLALWSVLAISASASKPASSAACLLCFIHGVRFGGEGDSRI